MDLVRCNVEFDILDDAGYEVGRAHHECAVGARIHTHGVAECRNQHIGKLGGVQMRQLDPLGHRQHGKERAARSGRSDYIVTVHPPDSVASRKHQLTQGVGQGHVEKVHRDEPADRDVGKNGDTCLHRDVPDRVGNICVEEYVVHEGIPGLRNSIVRLLCVYLNCGARKEQEKEP